MRVAEIAWNTTEYGLRAVVTASPSKFHHLCALHKLQMPNIVNFALVWSLVENEGFHERGSPSIFLVKNKFAAFLFLTRRAHVFALRFVCAGFVFGVCVDIGVWCVVCVCWILCFWQISLSPIFLHQGWSVEVGLSSSTTKTRMREAAECKQWCSYNARLSVATSVSSCR